MEMFTRLDFYFAHDCRIDSRPDVHGLPVLFLQPYIFHMCSPYRGTELIGEGGLPTGEQVIIPFALRASVSSQQKILYKIRATAIWCEDKCNALGCNL
jgi:hypothetical protein